MQQKVKFPVTVSKLGIVLLLFLEMGNEILTYTQK